MRKHGPHFAVLAAVAWIAAAAFADDWPRFLGPTSNSQSAEKGKLIPWGENGPPVVWHCKLGTSYGIGSVAAGRYYQFDRYGDQTRLTCLDAKTGQLLWRHEYPTDYEDRLGYNNGPRCSPVIDGDRIYLYGAEGMLYCVSAKDGASIWHIDTAKKFGVVQNFFGVGSTPIVFGDLLLVMVGGSPAECQDAGRFEMDHVTSNGTAVVAFDKHTGAVKFTTGNELASYATLQTARIDGRDWCFAFARGGLLGFDPTNGKIDFHYPWRSKLHDSVNASTPVVVGNEVLISDGYGPGSSLLRAKPGECEVVWRDPPSRDKALLCHWNTPIYRNGFLYGSSGRYSNTAELRCVEWKTGTVRWSQPDLGLASLLYVDGHFVCLGENGVLRLIRATEREYVEIAKAIVRETADGPMLIKPPAWAAPIVSDGLLYLRGVDRLVCLRLFSPK